MKALSAVEEVVKLLKQLNESELGHIECIAGKLRINLKFKELERLQKIGEKE